MSIVVRRIFAWSAVLAVVLAVVLAALAVLVVAAIHAVGVADGMTLSVDGETFDGPAVALVLGGLGIVTAFVVVVTTLATIASIAIVVPVLLAVLGVLVLGLLVVGLSPLLVPVLLVGGACALLFRSWRSAAPAPLVRSSAGPVPQSTGPSVPQR